jgi:hypothetical protein
MFSTNDSFVDTEIQACLRVETHARSLGEWDLVWISLGVARRSCHAFTRRSLSVSGIGFQVLWRRAYFDVLTSGP